MKQPIGQSGFAVVDMRDNAKISYVCCVHLAVCRGRLLM
jgi:hypothetical protein